MNSTSQTSRINPISVATIAAPMASVALAGSRRERRGEAPSLGSVAPAGDVAGAE